jgi:hypothetical protein
MEGAHMSSIAELIEADFWDDEEEDADAYDVLSTITSLLAVVAVSAMVILVVGVVLPIRAASRIVAG